MSKQALRTCLGCQKVHPKQELLRIVRTSDGQIEVDQTGKASGRGAYLCLVNDCPEEALKGEKIARALKVQPQNIDKRALGEMIQESRSKNDQKRSRKKRETNK